MDESSFVIVWFRRDLRLTDNPAMHQAISSGAKILPVFIYPPSKDLEWPIGSASKWWLHHSLKALDNSLRQLGTRIIIRHGDAIKNLLELIKETNSNSVFWNRLYEPCSIEQDTKIKSELIKAKIQVHTFNSSLLCEPWTIQNQSKRPFQVFTPYWKHLSSNIKLDPVFPKPDKIPSPINLPDSLNIEDIKLLPSISWDKQFYDYWRPGEPGAERSLNTFIHNIMSDYNDSRDIPSLLGTSRLSPHLHFGEISPKQIWSRVLESKASKTIGAETYLKELGWREFAHHLLFHFPHTPTQPLRSNFSNFPWVNDSGSLIAWQKGKTGYPIVDAGMRELWATGWMHNRVRMIVSSFLVKDLLISWQEGAKWFWNTLIDASLANNTLGWQWSGGCGADAAPFFRIFNPVTQGEKFDPEGTYVRRWVPELVDLPDKYLHHPWDTPQKILDAANVKLGVDYPFPIVDHNEARGRALRAFDRVKIR